MKKNLTLLLAVASAAAVIGCKAADRTELSVPVQSDAEEKTMQNETENEKIPSESELQVTEKVQKDEMFLDAMIEISPSEFEAAGFQLGDSCDVTFSNGYTLTDVPYYSGYYVAFGSPVIVAYPGREYICITYNYEGIWDQAGLEEGDTITISRREGGEYSAIQEVFAQEYSVDRKDYDSDVQFCNFRPLTGGNLKENFIFRGASPVDNSRNRAVLTDKLMEENGIRFEMDLADSEEKFQKDMEEEDFDSPIAADLYSKGDVVFLDLNSAYRAEEFQHKIAKGLRAMLAADAPVYIHCSEGKDRTGFVCILLEALAGASYDEMMADYMKSYKNYYSVTEEKTPEKYHAIAGLYFDDFMSYLHGTEDKDELKQADYTEDAASYLEACSMTTEEIENLKEYITKS